MVDDEYELHLDFSPDTDAAEGSDKLSPRIGRDEMNLAEFPFALLSDRAPEGLNTIQFEDTVEGKDGLLIKRTWTVTGGEKFGLPLAADEEVYVVLMEVTKEHGFDQRTIPITRYDLIKRLGWPNKGESYRRLREALDRLLGVTITARRAFWDKAKQRYVDVGFHIIDDYALYDEAPGRKRRDEQDPLPLSFISWSQVIFRSFQAGNIKQLDTAFYFSLRSSLSRRLYRYLDKKRYDGKGQYRIGLRKLAFEKLGMSRNYYPSQIKQELQRAHRELIQNGFLQGVEYEPASNGGEELVVYHFTRRKFQMAPAPQEPLLQELCDQLVEQGVTPGVAHQLVRDFGDEVRIQLQYLPYRGAQDPAAVLVEAIKGRWEPPASYLKARAEEQRRQQEQQRQTLLARQKAEEKARKELLRATTQALMAKLPDDDRSRLTAAATARVSDKSPAVASRPHSRAFAAMLNEELTELLRGEFPQDFERTRQQLLREAHIDLNDDL
jgi:hypothetical protein